MLAFGKFRREQKTAMLIAAGEAALELHLVESQPEATDWLNDHEACAMLIKSGEADEMAIRTRATAKHAQMPILALSPEIGDLCFEGAFSWGADDVVGTVRIRSLINRLRNLPRETVTNPAEDRGLALVAEPDQTRRVALARVLRNAGYTVSFALNHQDERAFSASPNLTLIVVNSELDSEPQEAIQCARKQGSQATWILTCAPKELRHYRARLAHIDSASAADGYSPPENVLFLANELRNTGIQNQRTSARILYGTTVAFRGAGRHEDEFGFSYNVSSTGLYVRTLVPPADNTTWLELCPPRSERRVRLVANVAWRRPFGRSDYATVPPGFGVQIVDGAREDLEAWRSGYASLDQSLG